MPVKLCMAGFVAIAGAAGAMYVGSADAIAAPVHPVVYFSPLPLDPAADLPTASQLLDLLNALQNPNVSFADKSHLVEGGISPMEAHLADARMKQAVAHGELPLTATVANIVPAGASAASADITLSGPKLTAVTQNLTFVDQGGWKISRAAAVTLLEETGAARS